MSKKNKNISETVKKVNDKKTAQTISTNKTNEVNNISGTKKYNSFEIGFVISLTIVMLVLCGITLANKLTAYYDQKKMLDEFYEVYESDELGIIYYSATDCIYCEKQTPIMEQIAKDYDLEYLSIDHTKLTEKQKLEIEETLDIKGSTPTTLVVKDGDVVAVNVGFIQGNKFVEFFIKAGVLEEGSKYIPEENLTFIGYEEFAELQKSEEPVVITIGGATCDYCAAAKPILSNLAKAYDTPIYYITLDYVTAEERISIVDDLETMKFADEKFNSNGSIATPTVIIVKNNEIISHLVGLSNVTTYTKMLKENGVIAD